jgi:hypothetical protein
VNADINPADEELDAVRWSDSDTLRRALIEALGDPEDDR